MGKLPPNLFESKFKFETSAIKEGDEVLIVDIDETQLAATIVPIYKTFIGEVGKVEKVFTSYPSAGIAYRVRVGLETLLLGPDEIIKTSNLPGLMSAWGL